jgi:hypothetical protein
VFCSGIRRASSVRTSPRLIATKKCHTPSIGCVYEVAGVVCAGSHVSGLLRRLRGAARCALPEVRGHGPAGPAGGWPTATRSRLGGGGLCLRRTGAGSPGPGQIPQFAVGSPAPGFGRGPTAGGGAARAGRRRDLAADHGHPPAWPGLRPGRAPRPGRRPGPGGAGRGLPHPPGRPVPNRPVGAGPPAGSDVRLRVVPGGGSAGSADRRRGHHRGHPDGGGPGPALRRGPLGGRGDGRPDAPSRQTA